MFEFGGGVPVPYQVCGYHNSLNENMLLNSRRRPYRKRVPNEQHLEQSSTMEPTIAPTIALTIVVEVARDSLSTVLNSYMYRIHVFLPLVDTLQASQLILELSGRCSNCADASIDMPLTNGSAITLQILALGELSITDSREDSPLVVHNGQSKLTLGRRYYEHALKILEHTCTVDSNSLEYVQATLLVAVYEMQLGNLLESWGWISYASKVLATISNNPDQAALVHWICWYMQR
jgi:hypothetical protein